MNHYVLVKRRGKRIVHRVLLDLGTRYIPRCAGILSEGIRGEPCFELEEGAYACGDCFRAEVDAGLFA